MTTELLAAPSTDQVPLTIVEPLPDASWLPLPKEPALWYTRFAKYFLPLGPSRTLTRAYLAFLKAERPDSKALGKKYTTMQVGWQLKCKAWRWRDRAEAFDQNALVDYVMYVDQARKTLLEAADSAAKALVEALGVPRSKVSAANAILDRVGLPSTSIVGVARIEPYTSEELSKAAQDLDSWEAKVRNGEVVDAKVIDE